MIQLGATIARNSYWACGVKTLVVVILLIGGGLQSILATNGWMNAARAQYPTIVGTKLNSCSLCHTQTPSLNAYGQDYRNANHNFTAVESRDSDGDGFSNIVEINAGRFPGDRTDFPPATTTTITTTTTSTTTTSTTPASSMLNFPRMVQNASQWTGFALANTASRPSQVTFAAFGNNGLPLPAGLGVSNTYSVMLAAGAQLAGVAFELFGPNLDTAASWVRVTGSQPGLAGFFLAFDPLIKTMDGVSVSGSTLQDLILAEPQGAELSLVNATASQPALTTIRFIDNQGMERGVQNLQIPINGRFSGASEDLFPSALVAAGGYLRINSTVGLSANEFFGVPGVCISTLDGLDPAGGGKIVYSPQYAVGGGMWKTTLTIINLENAATAVTLVLNSETGTPIGQPVILPLPPYGRAVLSDPSLFGILPSSSSPTEGYVRLSSSSTRIMGYVRFGDPADMQFQTALPFVSQGKTGALFSQLAQDGEYFTGVAMVNANPAAARVTIEAFRSDGTSAGNGTIDIAADGRQSKILDQIIPNLPPLRKGYFKLTSNQPVISFAVFATRSLSVLSAIPAQ